MKQIGWLAAFLALVATVGNGAEEYTVESLKEQRAVLAAERKDSEAKLQMRRQELEKSRDMAAANSEVEKATKALDKALADDAELKAARARLLAARKDLDAAVTGAASGSDDAKALDVQRGELEAKRARLQFHARLLDLQLSHSSSPARVEAESDEAVRAARQALVKIESEMADKPVATVTDALKELESARRKESEIWKALVEDNRALKAARESERASHDALRAAQASDKRQADLAAARKAHEEARAVAFKAIPEAKPLLAEMSKIENDVAAAESERRMANGMLNMFREKIRDDDRSVAKERDAWAAAEKAFDAVCPADIKELGAARKAAWNKQDQRRREIWSGREDKGLAAKRAAVEKEIEQLREKLLAGKSVLKDMSAALRSKAEIDEKIRAAADAPRGKEADAEDQEIKDLYGAFLAAKAKHVASLDAAPEVKKASVALNDARTALNAAVEERLASYDDAQPLRAMVDGLAGLRRGQDYRLAVLRFRLHDGMSPIAQAVAQGQNVVAAAAKVAELEKAIREKPLDSVTKADEAYSAARAKREKIEKDLREDSAYAKAVQAKQSAEKALRDAQTGDARAKAAVEARTALDRVVAEKIRTVPSGMTIAVEAEKVRNEIAEVEKAIHGVDTKKVELRRAAERGENTKVAVAKKAVAEAEAAVKAAEQSEKMATLRKAVDEARKAKDERLKEVVGKDKEYVKLMDDISVNAQVDKTFVEKMKALEKAAKGAAGK